MWQAYSFAALLAEAGGRIIDKTTMVKDVRRDAVLAAFQRAVAFWAFALAGGALGVFGELRFVHSWAVVVLGVMDVVSSVGYSHLLKNVELTAYSAVHYSIPFLFLLADVCFFEAVMTPAQAGGVLLLGLGGLLFVIDWRRLRARQMFRRLVWLILAFDVVFYGFEYYAFKHLHRSGGVNEVSFIASVWTLGVLFFVALVTWQGKWGSLPREAARDSYMLRTVVSKGVDFAASMLWLRAITLVEVSRVTAMGSLSPLVCLLGLLAAQKIFRVRAEEQLEGAMLWQKWAGTAALCAGAYLAR